MTLRSAVAGLGLAFATIVAQPALAGLPALAGVGVLKVGKGACSGTLIAPDLVLTAGHCVRPGADRTVRPRSVRFRTGAYPGHDAHAFDVSDIAVHPFYAPRETWSAEEVRHDIALIRLADAVSPQVAAPLIVATHPGPGERVFVASYRSSTQERAHERRCSILERFPGISVLSCEVRPGEGGSPVLVSDGTTIAVVGIVSASSRLMRTKVALSAEAAPLVGALRAILGES